MIAALITVAGTVRAFNPLPFSAGIHPHQSGVSVTEKDFAPQNEKRRH
jgi:hypothetical protein